MEEGLLNCRVWAPDRVSQSKWNFSVKPDPRGLPPVSDLGGPNGCGHQWVREEGREPWLGRVQPATRDAGRSDVRAAILGQLSPMGDRSLVQGQMPRERNPSPCSGASRGAPC